MGHQRAQEMSYVPFYGRAYGPPRRRSAVGGDCIPKRSLYRLLLGLHPK